MISEFSLLYKGISDDSNIGFPSTICQHIIEKALAVRDNLPSLPCNAIDYSLKPIPPYIGKNQIKLIFIGQDPTIRNARQRSKIKCTLNLDKANGILRKYIESICYGLGLSIDNVYATNLFKYFYTMPPADTPVVMQTHLTPNIELLKEELEKFDKCPIITLGEPILRLLTNATQKVRNHWNYKGSGFHYAFSHTLNRRIYPFPHQPSLRKELYQTNLKKYINYMASTAHIPSNNTHEDTD